MSRFATLLVVILAIPSVALASSVMRTGEAVSVAADQAVEGDFYGLGNDVTVAGEVQGDLVVLAGTLKVLSTAKISGDILFFGTDAEISGEVGKSIFGTSERMRVEGVVSGDIDVKTGTLTLGERADITGMVKYASSNEIVRAQNARVAGQVIQNE